MAGDDDVEIVGHITVSDDGTATVERYNDAVDQSGEKMGLWGGIAEHVGSIFDFAIGGVVKDAINSAIDAAKNFASSFVTDASEAENSSVHLAAMIKATGDASGYTYDQQMKLADSLKDLAGGSHETVESVEGILDRFKTISGTTFPQATKAVLDFAAATGMDATSAALRLGKALDSPGTAIASLRVAGVFFTTEQTKQLKAMTATNDVAGAQKIILEALANSTGGVASQMAQTFSGRMEILKNHLKDVAETIGGPLLGFLEPLITKLTTPVSGLVDSIKDLFSGDVIGGISNLRVVVEDFLTTLGVSRDTVWAVGDAIDRLGQLINGLIGAFKVGAAESGGFLGGLQNALYYLDNISPIFDTLGDDVANIWTIWDGFINAFKVGAEDGGGFIGGLSNALYSLDNISPIFDTLGDAVWKIADWITGKALPALQQFGIWFMTVGWPAIKNFASQILTQLIPGLQQLFIWISQLAAFLLPLLGKAIQFVMDNWKLVVPILAIVGAAILILSSPIAAIIAAIVLLATAWANNWGGIRDKLTAVWAVVQPILQKIWEWLQVNIPLAIATLKTFWEKTLLPAIQNVWNWVQTNVFPILKNLWDWLQTNIPKAIQTLTNFWTNTLLPAITNVWNWINTNLVPLFKALVTLLQVTLTLAITVCVGFWQNVLQPALASVWKYINDNILPIFKSVETWLGTTIGPIITTAIGWLGNLTGGFGGVSGAISDVVGWIDRLIEKLKHIKLPSWLTPGSPTDFEVGLWGISKALGSVNAQMNTFHNTTSNMNVYNNYSQQQYTLATQIAGNPSDLLSKFNLLQAVHNV